MMKSDTPRVDKFEMDRLITTGTPPDEAMNIRELDFARQLERELNEAKEELARWKNVSRICPDHSDAEIYLAGCPVCAKKMDHRDYKIIQLHYTLHGLYTACSTGILDPESYWMEAADRALSSDPAPKMMRMEDVLPLVEALTHIASIMQGKRESDDSTIDAGCTSFKSIERWANAATDFISKHPNK